jgi:hypothetical protein
MPKRTARSIGHGEAVGVGPQPMPSLERVLTRISIKNLEESTETPMHSASNLLQLLGLALKASKHMVAMNHALTASLES